MNILIFLSSSIGRAPDWGQAQNATKQICLVMPCDTASPKFNQGVGGSCPSSGALTQINYREK